MTKGSKYYVVWEGRQTGVFDTWEACKAQVDGFPTAKYKSFPNIDEAKTALAGKFWDYVQSSKPKLVSYSKSSNFDLNSICVDAACSGNPGVMEYRGVDTETKLQIFHKGPYTEGTNNIGEFLALVHGIAYLTKNSMNKLIYTDSETALAWVRNKKVKTKLEKSEINSELFDTLAKAEKYIQNTVHTIQIKKWETDQWGEIPADFGRK